MTDQTEPRTLILAIDPGLDKCGVAVVDTAAPSAGSRQVRERAVVPRAELAATVREWVARHHIATIVLGDRTGAAHVERELASLGLPVTVSRVDEHLSTLEGKRRYFIEHPPRGWRRLIPQGLLTPPVPYDDYVAVILAERYLGAPATTSP
jgi:RNase H-fold protein (predicted Holliday junction resolvase)